MRRDLMDFSEGGEGDCLFLLFGGFADRGLVGFGEVGDVVRDGAAVFEFEGGGRA